ncbi:MAG: hypothetical protein KDB27_30850 [Planctomycetales bacterium]|nr:hypothetical protein [Planctomycetales bacterium]
MAKNELVLLIEGDPDLADVVGIRVREAGYRVRTARRAVDGVCAAIEFQPQVILLGDCSQHVRTDVATTNSALIEHAQANHIPVLLLGSASYEQAIGTFGRVPTPLEGTVLTDLVTKAMEFAAFVELSRDRMLARMDTRHQPFVKHTAPAPVTEDRGVNDG